MDFRQLMRDERARRQREQQAAAAAASADVNRSSNDSDFASDNNSSGSDVSPALLQAPLRVWRERYVHGSRQQDTHSLDACAKRGVRSECT